MATRLAERVGSAPSNFTAALMAPDSEPAQQLVRDPYVFDHLALSGRAAERELEQGLVDRLEQTLLAFGRGMAFVERQVRFDVDGDELVLDLLLFSVEQLRYVVVELKIGQFDPAYVGQLGTYVAVVVDRLRRTDRHAPTVGILLCKGRNDTLVRYALAGSPAPLAVADYTYDSLPPQERGGLPTAAELRAALDALPPWAAPTDSAGDERWVRTMCARASRGEPRAGSGHCRAGTQRL